MQESVFVHCTTLNSAISFWRMRHRFIVRTSNMVLLLHDIYNENFTAFHGIIHRQVNKLLSGALNKHFHHSVDIQNKFCSQPYQTQQSTDTTMAADAVSRSA
jgi:hypothetical protein